MCVYVYVHTQFWMLTSPKIHRVNWQVGDPADAIAPVQRTAALGSRKNHFPAHEGNHDGTALPLLLFFIFQLGSLPGFDGHLLPLRPPLPYFFMDKIFHPPKYFVYSYEHNGSAMKLP